MSSHPGRLHAVGQHEKCGAPLSLHQAPEVAHSVGKGALGCKELPEAPETLGEETGRSRPASPGPRLPTLIQHPPGSQPQPYRDAAGVDVLGARLPREGCQGHTGPVI